MYATVENICTNYGYREISELLWDEENDITEILLRDAVAENDLSAYTQQEQNSIALAIARVNIMLQQQSNKIDTYVGSAYVLPLTIEVVDATPLQECCAALTRAVLSDDGDNLAKHILDERKHWLEWLKNLAKRDIVLPGAQRVPIDETGTGYDNRRLTKTPSSCIDFSNY